MKNLINRIRENNTFYFISLICTIIFIVCVLALTSESYHWSRHLIIVGIFIMFYLTHFIGVNPILKGLGLTTIPILLTIIITILTDRYIPDELYQKWFEFDKPGTSIQGGFLILSLAIVPKIFKVKPYIFELENKNEQKRVS